jgi:hypothetical protein
MVSTLLLPLLMLALALLPGWVARQRLRHVAGQGPDRAPRSQAALGALLCAAGLHALVLGLHAMVLGLQGLVGTATAATHVATAAAHVAPSAAATGAMGGGGFGVGPLAGAWLSLLSPDPTTQAAALVAVNAHLGALVAHLALVGLLALALPTALRRLVTRLRLDRRRARWAPLLRAPDAPWYYLFSGADFDADAVPDLVAVSAVLEVAGQPWLYKGIVDEYFVDREGRLDRLLLQQVVRRPVGPTGPGVARGGRDTLESVDGDCVVLRCDEASLLRVEYIRLSRTGEPPSRQPPADLLGQGFEPTQPV